MFKKAKRNLVLVAVLFSATITAGQALATETFPLPLVYNSPDTPLSYRYDVHSGDPGTLVRGIQISTSYGELRASLNYTPSLGLVSSSLWIDGTSPTITLTIARATNPQYFTWVIGFGTLGSMTYTIDPNAQRIISIASTVTDCDGVGNLSVTKAISEVASRLENDMTVKTTVPDQESAISRFIWVNWLYPRLVADCRDALITPQLCNISPDFPSCTQCCKDNALANTACKLATAGCVPFGELPLCWGIAAGCILAADTVQEFEIAKCSSVACTGKPGDPSCDPNITCGQAGGVCVGICVGQAVCGKCAGGTQPNCCR